MPKISATPRRTLFQVLGELDTLGQVNATLVESIRYRDGPSATQKWGPNHSSGVARIVTR